MPMLRAIFLLQTDSHFRVYLSCFEIIQLHVSHRALVSSRVYRARPGGYSVYTVIRCPISVSTQLNGSPTKQSVLSPEGYAFKGALHGGEVTEKLLREIEEIAGA